MTDEAIKPAAALATKISAAAEAVIVATGPIRGGYIVNPLDLEGQGVAAEPLNVDMVGVPGGTPADVNGTTCALLPGQTFIIPKLASGVLLRANAATAGHKFTAVVYLD